jgi:hypothetical protein
VLKNHAFSGASFNKWVSLNFQTFQKIQNVGQLLWRNRAVWSGSCSERCCLYSGICEHPGTGKWPLKKAGAVWASKWPYWLKTTSARRHLCGRPRSCRYECHFFSTRSSDVGLRYNGDRPAPQRRHTWCISSKLILNFTRTIIWKNERQAGETTGNLKIRRRQWDLWRRLNRWCNRCPNIDPPDDSQRCLAIHRSMLERCTNDGLLMGEKCRASVETSLIFNYNLLSPYDPHRCAWWL